MLNHKLLEFLFSYVIALGLLLFNVPAFSQSQTLKYSYDELGRLTYVEDNRNGDRDYDYDPAGNRILVTVTSVVTPTISPNGGNFTSPQSVTLSTSTSGAWIRFTINGSDVTPTSALYTGPIPLSTSATIKAKAFKTGILDSAQASAQFTINIPQPPVATPIISPNGGSFTSTQTVSITTTTSDATIRYTTNGSDVSAISPIYTGPFPISSSATVKAKGFKTGMSESTQASAPFSIVQTVGTPSINPNGGTFNSPQTVSITVSPGDATIRYTTNGSDVSASSPIYSGPFTVSSSATVKAKGFKTGMNESTQASAPFTIVETVSKPSISPGGGTYTSPPTVSITSTTSGATIRYTTNGSDVTANSPIYTGSFTINSSTTIKAKGFKAGMNESVQAAEQFTLMLPVSMPVISPPGGTFNSPQTVSISTSTSGATIRFTTNGSAVTSSSPVYMGPFTISSSAMVRARGFQTGMLDSIETANQFTINSMQFVATPSISPAGGTFTSAQTVSISTTTSGATIRYTTDGNNVSTGSPAYTGPFIVNSSTTVRAKAFKSGMNESTQSAAPFTINIPGISAPTGLSSLPKSFTGTTGLYESKWNSVAGATYYTLRTIGGVESTTTQTLVIHQTKGHWVKACNANGCSQAAIF